jgi:hypothetical protein
VDVYSTSRNTWSTASLSQSRRWLAATSAKNQIFFGGGESSTSESNVVDIFCVGINCPVPTGTLMNLSFDAFLKLSVSLNVIEFHLSEN